MQQQSGAHLQVPWLICKQVQLHEQQQAIYAEAQQQYAEMHARLDESTALAKEVWTRFNLVMLFLQLGFDNATCQVGCVACVLGDTSCAVDGQSFSEDELKLYQELQPVAPWGDSGTDNTPSLSMPKSCLSRDCAMCAQGRPWNVQTELWDRLLAAWLQMRLPWACTGRQTWSLFR
eukprot:scaffold43542_cov17-Tisochrysis_lutea.AAC.1